MLCPIRLAIQPLLLPLAVVSPISLPALATELSSHPSASFRQYLLSGFPEGFQVGFQPARIHQIHFTAENMTSALNTPPLVEEYLACKVYLGRVAGPFASPPFPSFHVSSFGVIPKCGRPGKWRLIRDLLHLKGGSVNDGINGMISPLSYARVNDAIDFIMQEGLGTLLAKINIHDAYRLVAVHVEDRYPPWYEVERAVLR